MRHKRLELHYHELLIKGHASGSTSGVKGQLGGDEEHISELGRERQLS